MGGEISWELDSGFAEDLSEFSFFSLRVGQELILPDLNTCELMVADPRREAVMLAIRLEDDQANSAEALLGPIIQQDSKLVSNGIADPQCVAKQFMQTLRIPMDSFCETPGFDIESVVSVTIEFPELEYGAGVFIDTVEFSSHPLDDGHLCL